MYVCVCVSVHVRAITYMSTCAHRGQKGVLESPELEIQAVVSVLM